MDINEISATHGLTFSPMGARARKPVEGTIPLATHSSTDSFRAGRETDTWLERITNARLLQYSKMGDPMAMVCR